VSLSFFFLFTARGSFLVPTYLAFSLPAGTYGRLSTRSSMAIQGIDVCAGVIDADYTGEVKVLLHNRSPNLYRALRGDRIAQIIATRIDYPLLYEINELNETRRGAEGFGSSGI
jgi:dUTP pyrophosphatase